MERLTLWDAGFAPPTIALNDRLVGDSAIVGGGATVRLTPMLTLVAPVAITVIVAEYVPRDSPFVLTTALIEPAPVPLAGSSVSHVASSVADQLSVPPPEFVTEIDCAAGSAPLGAVNVSVPVDT